MNFTFWDFLESGRFFLNETDEIFERRIKKMLNVSNSKDHRHNGL